MAKVTYSDKVALNVNPEIADINKVKDTDMNEIKNAINSNETKILIAVSDTEPAECSTGDLYFNTNDNLIYEATGTDTWSSTGVAPTENTIYILFNSQTAYAYDGITLVSVGGGTLNYNELSNKPSINNVQLSGNKTSSDLGIPNTMNTQSNSTTDAYSCDYINNTYGKGIKTAVVYNNSVQLTNRNADSNNVLTLTPVDGTVLLYFIDESWPLESWDGGGLVEIGRMFREENKITLKTNTTQRYTIKIRALYISE